MESIDLEWSEAKSTPIHRDLQVSSRRRGATVDVQQGLSIFFAETQGKCSFSEGLQFYNGDIHGDFFGAIFRQKNVKKVVWNYSKF